MVTPIFNLNDILLIITIVASLVLALVQPILPAKKTNNRIVLAGFFLSLAISNTGVMLMWNEYIHSPEWVNGLIPYLYSVAVLLKGPALYLYVASITDDGFRWRTRDLGHLAVVFCVWPLLVLFDIDLRALRLQGVDTASQRDFVIHLIWYLLKIIPLAYFVAATVRAFRYHRQLESQFSDVDARSLTWLYSLAISCVFAGIWSLMVTVLFDAFGLPLGITDNYVSFILLLALCYYSLSHAQDVTATSEEYEEPAAEPVEQKPLDSLTRQILQGVEVDKLYLNHTLNIEQFSQAIGLPAREVSYAINKVFGKNFFEFINFYRIEAAKRMLEDPAQAHLTVLEILMGAGFNSKSSFQRFFKRLTGVSPTEYRERQLKASAEAMV